MHENIFDNYEPKNRSNLIALLQEVQDIYGYLPEVALKDVADFLDMPSSSVYGVATFYNQFRLTPLGKHVIKVCRGTACHVKNSGDILTALENELECKAGETTRDKMFTLETVACIGACSIAPVISIDEEFYGRLAVKDIPKLIKRFKKGEEQKTKNQKASVK